MGERKANKAVIGAFFASLRFGVAAPLYPKTPLHKKCLIQRLQAVEKPNGFWLLRIYRASTLI